MLKYFIVYRRWVFLFLLLFCFFGDKDIFSDCYTAWQQLSVAMSLEGQSKIPGDSDFITARWKREFGLFLLAKLTLSGYRRWLGKVLEKVYMSWATPGPWCSADWPPSLPADEINWGRTAIYWPHGKPSPASVEFRRANEDRPLRLITKWLSRTDVWHTTSRTIISWTKRKDFMNYARTRQARQICQAHTNTPT